MDNGLLLIEGVRTICVAWQRKRTGPKRYDGSAREICEQIVRACFHPGKQFFMTSVHSYPEFYARDFGRCVPALLAAGLEREVGDTYRYAFRQYLRGGRFSLIITPGDRLLDFPHYAPDGFALFLWGLCHLSDRTLVDRHRGFLEREISRFFQKVIEPGTGAVRRGVHFSEAQDFSVRSSSCYSNVMCYLLQQSLDALGLPNPLSAFDYQGLLLREYWNGDCFFDDANRGGYVTADAAILPFWSGLMGEDALARQRFAAVLARIDAEGLNEPLPSRYGRADQPGRKMLWLDRFNPWQRDAVWTCLGIHLLETLRRFQPPRYALELRRYREMIERLGCFPELLDGRTGELFQSRCYMADDSMLWAASLLPHLSEMKAEAKPATQR